MKTGRPKKARPVGRPKKVIKRGRPKKEAVPDGRRASRRAADDAAGHAIRMATQARRRAKDKAAVKKLGKTCRRAEEKAAEEKAAAARKEKVRAKNAKQKVRRLAEEKAAQDRRLAAAKNGPGLQRKPAQDNLLAAARNGPGLQRKRKLSRRQAAVGPCRCSRRHLVKCRCSQNAAMCSLKTQIREALAQQRAADHKRRRAEAESVREVDLANVAEKRLRKATQHLRQVEAVDQDKEQAVQRLRQRIAQREERDAHAEESPSAELARAFYTLAAREDPLSPELKSCPDPG